MKGKPEWQKVMILGKAYTLRRVRDHQAMGMYGSSDRKGQNIVVNMDLEPDQYEETLLHETLHIIDGELKLGLSEATVCRLAVGLHSSGIKMVLPEIEIP